MQFLTFNADRAPPEPRAPMGLLTEFYSKYPPGAALSSLPYGIVFLRARLIDVTSTSMLRMWRLQNGWTACGCDRGERLEARTDAGDGADHCLQVGLTDDGRFLHAWDSPGCLDLRCDTIPFVPSEVMDWVRTGERGESADALCKALYPAVPLRASIEHPEDLDDFRRCFQMLNLVDPTRIRLKVTVPPSPRWVGLLRVWSEIERLYAIGEREEAGQRLLSALST